MTTVSAVPEKIADACRFCWMCRHICPIGSATGQERHNARARALSLSMVSRGAAQLSGSIANNIYECALCGACTSDCATGWDPVAFTRDARLQLALDGETPAYIARLLENIARTGNPYGAETIDTALSAEIASLDPGAKTLLFLGADARYKVPETAISAIRLLRASGTVFTVLAQEPDSGAALYTLAGAAEETREAMAAAAQQLSAFEKVIALDPADASVFLREYRAWDVPLSASVQTFTAFAAELVASGALRMKKSVRRIAVQDPAALARDLEETVPLRDIASSCGEVREMLLHGRQTVFAGSLLMNEWMPEVMALTAQLRWRSALAADAEVLIAASPAEYALLRDTQPPAVRVLPVQALMLESLEG